MKKVKSCELFKIVSVFEDDNIIDVAKKIHKFQERRVFVLNKKKFPVGIISIVDINDKVVAKNLNLKKTKAKDVMSYPVNLVFDIKDNIDEVLKKMVLKDIFYAPVIDNGKVKGLLVYANAVKCFGK